MATTIALAGNPNSGKTTMFNDLTGATQYVGNWPGVTVEKKEGKLRGRKDVTVTDLPGIYSLSPYSPEEVVSRDYLLGGGAGAILNLVDGTNLERNLYLTTQLAEVGLPMVVALNMMDLVKKNGDKMDEKKLSEMLGCPVKATSALRSTGTSEAAAEAAKLAADGAAAPAPMQFSAEVEAALGAIATMLGSRVAENRRRWFSVKAFERDELALSQLGLSAAEKKQLEDIVVPVEDKLDDDSESIITSQRYDRIADIMAACVKKTQRTMSTSDKIDRVVTNRWLALPIFAAIMFLVYFIAVTTLGTFVTDWANDTLFGEWIGGGIETLLVNVGAADWLISLIVEGIIAGVGAVLGFVPQMIILFLLLGFLEDVGYMARVAFIMDRIFRKFGLSGKSFIPMLISSGCGIPGIMATKTIENEKDRRMTIITTTFIPCGAKLPIIALIAGALFGGGWWVAPLIYFIGIAAVIVSGIMLKKTPLFAGEPAPFVMELPQYHLPAIKNLLLHMWERVRSFVVKAGTIIFASSIVIWFLLGYGVVDGSFGRVEPLVEQGIEAGVLDEETPAIDYSIMATVGNVIAPVFEPVGFGNWKASVGVVTGLVAKENLVSTLSIIGNMDEDAAMEGDTEADARISVVMGGMVAGALGGMAYLIFNMLCAPCFAAIGAISRNMQSWKWTLFAVAYQCVFAYCISLMVFQFGSLFIGGGFGVGTVAAIIVLLIFLFMLFRPAPKSNKKAQAAAAHS